MRKELKVLEDAERAAKQRNKEKLIDDLMFGDGDSEKILSEHRESVKQEETRMKTFSTGEEMGKSVQNITIVEDEPYVYQPLDTSGWYKGPSPPDDTELMEGGYIQNIR